jgi:hypothetical protein
MSSCPKCGRQVDTCVESTPRPLSRPPKAGDMCVCIACGAVVRLGADLEMQQLTESEWRLLPLPVRLQLRQMQALVHARN